MGQRGFGVAAGLDPAVARSLAERCESLGYSSIWSNDHPGANGLDTVAAFPQGSAPLERDFAAKARAHVEAGARDAGRKPPPVLGYVRTAVGPDAPERLAKEESFYRDLHDGYRNHFARLGEPEGTVGVAARDRDGVQAELA